MENPVTTPDVVQDHVDGAKKSIAGCIKASKDVIDIVEKAVYGGDTEEIDVLDEKCDILKESIKRMRELTSGAHPYPPEHLDDPGLKDMLIEIDSLMKKIAMLKIVVDLRQLPSS